ncbi:MAG: hypothetical protein IT555_16905 [Acetobacteraceae bacterium]|nr:hypothetical protein [Acetobacteraceae bacterium]
MPIFITLLCAILTDLRAAIGAHLGRDRTHQALLTEAWARIGRMSRRLQTLYSRWQAGTLPRLRPSRAGQSVTGQSRTDPPARAYFPRGHAWLASHADHHVRGHASQLAHLLARPDAEAFLAAVPRAGRILRPLCRMLGIAVPAPIALPPRPRKPRPRPRPAPRQPPRHGKYTPAQLRHYRPGRIPRRSPGSA